MISREHFIEDEKAYEKELRAFANMDNTSKKIITNDEIDYLISTVVHLKLKEFLLMNSLGDI